MSKYFIGVIPSELIYNEVLDVQEKYMSKIGVEPHITLKAQSKLTDDKRWISKIEKIIKKTNKFYITPKNIDFFGKDVLFLCFDSQELKSLHHQIVDELDVPNDLKEEYFEGDLFVPHLTIGKVLYSDDISTGNTYQNLLKMKEELLTKNIFDKFLVEKVYIYEFKDNQYKRIQSISLY